MKSFVFSMLLGLILLACAGEPEPEAGGLGSHRGAVLSVRPAAVWAATKETLGALGPLRVEEDARTASTDTPTGKITVRVDPYDAAGEKSILRVRARSGGTDDPELADQVQLAIHRRLLAR